MLYRLCEQHGVGLTVMKPYAGGPRADILAILPGGTDMPLDIPFFPVAGNRLSYIGAHVRYGEKSR